MNGVGKDRGESAGLVSFDLLLPEIRPMFLGVFVRLVGRDAGNHFENREGAVADFEVAAIVGFAYQSMVGDDVEADIVFLDSVYPVDQSYD